MSEIKCHGYKLRACNREERRSKTMQAQPASCICSNTLATFTGLNRSLYLTVNFDR